ncbi:MAG TPA: hypothetical protein VGB75_07600 [Jatrophihabitans sp.]|jgi:hypothetical protein|uniref:hypothetical protein n=1 Tax=Jatrophihabitans sp. TaxID=1932789 RepID=UPI002EE52798
MVSAARPRLLAGIARVEDLLVLGEGPDAVEVQAPAEHLDTVHRFLTALDGTQEVSAAAAAAGLPLPEAAQLVSQLADQDLVRGDLVREGGPAHQPISGTAALLELEDLVTGQLYDTLYKNPYWQAMQDPAAVIPELVLQGTIVENYHFLFRESWFDAPALSYPYSRGVRVSLNEFFVEESGHDELILNSLKSLGHTRDDLADTIPLQTTAALCNSLAWWSRTDPLFFITTIGVLEGRDLAVDSFVRACESRDVDPDLVGPMRTHSQINLAGGHGSLTRQVFADIPAISAQTLSRLRARTVLFVELYDDFYRGIWEHYSTATTLLRSISGLVGDVMGIGTAEEAL